VLISYRFLYCPLNLTALFKLTSERNLMKSHPMSYRVLLLIATAAAGLTIARPAIVSGQQPSVATLPAAERTDSFETKMKLLQLLRGIEKTTISLDL
jgi:hypothetical protein